MHGRLWIQYSAVGTKIQGQRIVIPRGDVRLSQDVFTGGINIAYDDPMSGNRSTVVAYLVFTHILSE